MRPHTSRATRQPRAALGYLAAGVAVSALSVWHFCAWRWKASPIETTSGDAEDALRRTPSTDNLSERRLRVLYLGFLLAAVAALGVDCSVAQCVADKCPALVHDLLEPCAAFGCWVGVLVVLAAIHQLDPPRRRLLWWPLACALLSGMAANGAKMLVARTRPYAFDFQGNVWTTFGRWLPAADMGQSLPSGHTATAVGLALALAAPIPTGGDSFCSWPFWSPASGSSAARIFERCSLRRGDRLSHGGLLLALGPLGLRGVLSGGRKA